MTDFNFHLSQLPNFLQGEVHAAAGVTTGLPYDQIIARYRAATEHLIAVKHATYPPVPGYPLTKAQIDTMMAQFSDPNLDFSKAIHVQFMKAQFGYQSIRFLTTFSHFLISFQAQLIEAARQLAQRQAQEAAQRLAQQQAEAAARLNAQRQAEEAARLLIQRQAEEAARLLAQQQAEEAARQLSQRQAEEAQLAQRQAEEEALLVIRPQVEQSAIRQIVERAVDDALKTAGVGEIDTSALTAFEDAASKLETDVKVALAGFSKAINRDTSISATDAFSAMLYALKQTGMEVQAAYEGRMP